MSRYVVSRILAAIPVLFVISLLAFGLQAISPGDPAALLLQASGDTNPSSEEIAAKRAELHLDDSVLTRYLDWLGNAVRGDFGRSFRSYTPVTQLYRERIGNTILLAGTAALLAALIAIPLGILAALHRGGPLDGLAQFVAVLGSAMPGFWIALVLILIFAVHLHWVPAISKVTPRGIVLPAIVIALPNIALITRLTRASMLDVLGQEFVVVARAKGLTSGNVTFRHIIPNVTVPVVTVLGLETAELMTGAAVVEYVFAWPGIGKMAVDAALLRDIPVIVGFAIAAGLIFVVANLIVDLVIAAIDPRVRSI
ncbi:MAG: ABC transporter permease [Thermomicrobiales bacterium]